MSDKIEKDDFMQLYKVKRAEDNSTIYIVAKDFNDLQEDLFESMIEPLEIIATEEVFITSSILNNNK